MHSANCGEPTSIHYMCKLAYTAWHSRDYDEHMGTIRFSCWHDCRYSAIVSMVKHANPRWYHMALDSVREYEQIRDSFKKEKI